MSAYYNEIDPYAAQWLRKLIAKGLIAPGDVDERSITEVDPDELSDYNQCHFFAGIGGWSYALRLAGWPDDRPVWTGSCPCQPFSSAGKQRGCDDERHLWPAFFRLIRERSPATVFGEQVAGANGYAWWDHVAADLESEGYAAAACDLGAHSAGAPHIRQRLYWMAKSDGGRCEMADCEFCGYSFDVGRLGRYGCPNCCGEGLDDVGDSSIERLERHRADQESCRRFGTEGSVTETGPFDAWRELEWLACSDGKARPTQSGLFPLANGVPGRVGRLRAYGNAIVPQVAALFITASR